MSHRDVERRDTLVTNEKIKVDDPTFVFYFRDVRDDTIDCPTPSAGCRGDVGMTQSTARPPSAGGRGDVEMMPPIATRFGPVSSSENGPEMRRKSSRKRGVFRTFYKFAPRFEKTGEIPRLSQRVRGREIRTSKKKDLFFTEGFHPPYEALELPNNRRDKSPRFVDRLGPPSRQHFRVGNRCHSTPYGLAARDIFFFIFCATASPSATE